MGKKWWASNFMVIGAYDRRDVEFNWTPTLTCYKGKGEPSRWQDVIFEKNTLSLEDYLLEFKCLCDSLAAIHKPLSD